MEQSSRTFPKVAVVCDGALTGEGVPYVAFIVAGNRMISTLTRRIDGLQACAIRGGL